MTQSIRAIAVAAAILAAKAMTPRVVIVCQKKDIECGNNPNLWCTTCPKKVAKAKHECPVCREEHES